MKAYVSQENLGRKSFASVKFDTSEILYLKA